MKPKIRRPEFSFDCPFCGKHVEGCLGDDPWVIHILPMCQNFDDLEPTDYLDACIQVVRSAALRGNQDKGTA